MTLCNLLLHDELAVFGLRGLVWKRIVRNLVLLRDLLLDLVYLGAQFRVALQRVVDISTRVYAAVAADGNHELGETRDQRHVVRLRCERV